MTLNGHFALGLKMHAFSGPTTKILMKRDPYYHRERCSRMTADNIWFTRIFAGVPWRWGAKRQCGNRKRQFSELSDASYRHLRKWHILYYLAPCRLSTDPKIHDLDWPFYVKFSLLRTALWEIILRTYCRVCLHAWPAEMCGSGMFLVEEEQLKIWLEWGWGRQWLVQ